ncbi:MAG: PEGA domain-containing protein [Byssovorax sp.]
MRRGAATLLAAILLSGASSPARADDAAPDASDRKAQARAHFDKAKGLSQGGAWSAALAEYLASRDLFPTWGNTLGAASSLRKLDRFDESLDLFEVLLRDFPGALPPDVRAAAQHEVIELRDLVGTIEVEGAEIGAHITIDGVARGEHPAPSPLRVGAGSHFLRVSKEGFETFERRLDVAGKQTARVSATMPALAASGRLRVAEQSGRSLDVLVDGGAVGKTPWEGRLSLGEHVVLLRGDGDEGTPPLPVSVKRDETTRITLAAERLAAEVRIEPLPVSASIAIDAVAIGQGIWEGRLRAGKHKIEAAAPGFVAAARDVTLGAGERSVIAIPLTRDPSSPFWRRPPRPSHGSFEATAGVPVLPSFGGDIAGGCTGSCSAAPGFGAMVTVRGGYELSSGLSFGLSAGFLTVQESITGRSAAVQPVGLKAAAQGELDHTLSLHRGVMVGPFLGFALGDRFPVRARVGAGGLFAWMTDTRSGTFDAVHEGPPFQVGPLSTTSFAPMVFVAPDLRVGMRLGPRFELDLGVDLLALIALTDPVWDGSRPINAGSDGIGTFPTERLGGRVLFAIAPGIGARYDLL